MAVACRVSLTLFTLLSTIQSKLARVGTSSPIVPDRHGFGLGRVLECGSLTAAMRPPNEFHRHSLRFLFSSQSYRKTFLLARNGFAVEESKWRT